MDAKQCANCGTELSPDLPQGLCPACLLETGILNEGASTTVSNTAIPHSPTGVATTVTDGIRRFGPYELLSEIARGGQGVVYRARHTTLNREVALKMLPLTPWSTEAHLKRFRIEARATAELDHPGIVPIYDIGEVDGQHYFTMKLIDGVGLNRVPAGSLSVRRAAEIMVEAAHALQHAHDHGVLHRDIKPGNIILDPAGHPHLADFGLAKLVESDGTITQTRELLGTPSYVSPEMARGDAKQVGTATDVYGLGAVLYQLLTGNPPFAGGTTLETIRQVIETDPRPPRAWNPKVDSDLEVICLKCLEKDPSRRYASAGALADDVDRWLRNEPIRARPASRIYRTRKWFRRNARPAAAAGVLVLIAALVIVSVKYAATPAPVAPGIAVLFRPANADSKYIATEFSRNFIHSLGRLPGLTVAPRAAVLKWENASAAADDAGKALGVPVIFFGTVQQSGEAFRLEAELINVRSGAHLWRKTFQEPLSAAPGAQVQIVRMIATTLGIELSEANRAEMRRPLTTDPEAWLHYLHARQHNETLSEPKLLQAVGELELALAKDPEFAEAYAALANAHLDLGYTYRNPAVHLSKAKAYVAEALKRDETLVEAIIVQGAVSYFFDWDWAAAERAVKQAVLLDPSALENHACYLHSLETTGRAGEAIEAVRLASAHYPSSIAIQSELGCSTYYAGKFSEAAVYSDQVRKNDPQNPYLDWGFARALAQLGRFEEAIDVLTAAQRKPDGDWTAILSELAYVRGRENRRDDALLAIQQLRARSKTEFVDPYLFAMAYAGIGDKDEVFRNLELAASVRSSWIPSLPVEPKFAALRMEPRFQQVLATLKLPASR